MVATQPVDTCCDSLPSSYRTWPAPPLGPNLKPSLVLHDSESPLLLELFDHMLGREVEVDFGGLERVMPQQAL